MNIINTRLSYYDELRAQMRLNEEQLDKLESLLLVEKVKLAFYFAAGACIVLALAGAGFLLLSGGRFEIAERYSALMNIAVIFLFFGLLEIFSLFIAALSLFHEIRQLVKRQIIALKSAEAELATA